MARPKVKIEGARLWGIVILACAGSFALGWFIKTITTHIVEPTAIRLSGYQYISPLISCNLNSTKLFPQNSTVANDLQSVISQDQSAGDITRASVYFADFNTGKWANVNGSDQYYPASLGKVPIMMAIYEMAENTSSILDEQASYPLGLPDLNTQQEIPPANSITPGQSYSLNDLVNYMIKYSDNDAAAVLANTADQTDLTGIYSDLGIPLSNDVTASTSDIMTPQQYSILFRTLYNATYLSRDYSEKALELMTQTEFTQGIVAGVPSSTVVSHKYGLASYTSGGVPEEWELHDCGIVYAPSNPYLLCVMTDGTTSIAAQEKTIADISRVAYSEVENGFQ
jgi:beta-lactamase class A